MGRWVTSKGRRIYIPDEGEENPYAKKSDNGSHKKAADFQNNQKLADKYNEYVDANPDEDGYTHKISHTNGNAGYATIVDRVYKGNEYIGTEQVGLETNKDGDVDYIRNGTRYKDISYLTDAGKGKRVPYYIDQQRGLKNQINKDSVLKQKQIASNKAQADERNGIPARSQEEINSGKYNKYKQGMAYKNAKTVQVNGKNYKVWGDTTYKGTFAEDEHGNVLPIMGSGYLTKELSQRKAIANKFGEETFRKNKKKGK